MSSFNKSMNHVELQRWWFCACSCHSLNSVLHRLLFLKVYADAIRKERASIRWHFLFSLRLNAAKYLFNSCFSDTVRVTLFLSLISLMVSVDVKHHERRSAYSIRLTSRGRGPHKILLRLRHTPAMEKRRPMPYKEDQHDMQPANTATPAVQPRCLKIWRGNHVQEN